MFSALRSWVGVYRNLKLDRRTDLQTNRLEYQISVTDFVGTIDLLIYLVHQKEMDVAEISLSEITSNYVDWWQDNYSVGSAVFDLLKSTELWNSFGDFILAAAILFEYKASTLLPEEIVELEAQAPEWWRENSAELLLAYQSGIDILDGLEMEQTAWFDRGNVYVAGLESDVRSELLSSVSLHNLAEIFHSITRQLPAEPDARIDKIPYTIEGQKAFVLSFFKSSNHIHFDVIASSLKSKIAVVTTFLALLELIRQREIIVRQEKNFAPLSIILTNRVDDGR